MKELVLPLQAHAHLVVHSATSEPMLAPGTVVQVEVVTPAGRLLVDLTWLEAVVTDLASAFEHLSMGQRELSSEQAAYLGYWYNVELYHVYCGEQLPTLPIPTEYAPTQLRRYALFGGSSCATWLYQWNGRSYLQASPYFPYLDSLTTSASTHYGFNRWLTQYQLLLTIELEARAVQYLREKCGEWQRAIDAYYTAHAANPFGASY